MLENGGSLVYDGGARERETLVVELDIPDLEMLLFSCVCTPVLLYTHPSCKVWGDIIPPAEVWVPVVPRRGFEEIFWDVCWPIVCGPMVLGDP